jgi:hypothetical protein
MFISIFLLVSYKANCQNGSTQPLFQDLYSKKMGMLRLSASNFDLGVIRNNEIRNDTIYIYNSGKKPLTISAPSKLPPYLKLLIIGSPLKPSSKGMITVSYDAIKKNDYGFVMDRIELMTDDTLQLKKYITISATLTEYFPIPSVGDSLKPVARILENNFNFGVIKQGVKSGHDFKIFNAGTKTLLLHKTKSSCDCLKSNISKKEILPGDSAVLHVDFDSVGKEGRETRSVFLYVNDPAMPEIKFDFTGEVKKQVP